MRCLLCHIAVSGDVCPRCNVYLPSLRRDTLPAGTYLSGGAYRIDDVLGRGGFGITYQATHMKLQDEVAIKELFPELYARRESASGDLLIPEEQQAEFAHEVQRFREEGRCLKDLRAPGVVNVRDMFDEHGTIYLVMDFVRGKTLRAELDASCGQGLPVERVKRIVEQLVTALQTVHERQVYHLDIKPENVLLTVSGQIVLIDFGAARRTVNTTTRRQFDLTYAAPELLTRQEVGPESDVFELGMLVHELLTGQCPPSAFACLLQGQPQVLAADLEDPWRGLVERALLLEKALRPASVKAWWEARWDGLPPPRPTSIPHPTSTIDQAGAQVGVAFQAIPLVAGTTPAPAAEAQSLRDAFQPGQRMPAPIPVVISSSPQLTPCGNRPAGVLVALLILAGLVLLVLLLLVLTR